MPDLKLAAILDAAEALRLAGRWERAAALLADLEPLTDVERAVVALAVADVAVDHFWWRDGVDPEPAVAAAAEAVAAVAGADPVAAWDLELLRLRVDYGAAFQSRVAEGFDDEVDPARVENGQRLSEWSVRLGSTAADPLRRGWAAFWGGVTAELLLADPALARERYEQARAAAEDTGEDLLLSYALRHLGDHAKTAGDLVTARDAWIRSTSLRDRLGFVPGAIAQRLALADLLLSEGDRAGAAALATDVARTVEALGLRPGLRDAAIDLAGRAKDTADSPAAGDARAV